MLLEENTKLFSLRGVLKVVSFTLKKDVSLDFEKGREEGRGRS